MSAIRKKPVEKTILENYELRLGAKQLKSENAELAADLRATMERAEIERLQALLLQVVEQRWHQPSIRAGLLDEICEELGCGRDPNKWDENTLGKRNVQRNAPRR